MSKYLAFKARCEQANPTALGKRQRARQRKRERQAAEQARKDAAAKFYEGNEWRRLRMRALVKHGGRCQCCGATAHDGERIHVDHIKPRR